jgi:SOS response regulatory protein OraA/RecX
MGQALAGVDESGHQSAAVQYAGPAAGLRGAGASTRADEVLATPTEADEVSAAHRRAAKVWAAPTPAEEVSPVHRRAAEVSAAQDTALRFLAQRPRSEHEVRLRLRRQQVDDQTIAQVLDRLRAVGLVDDGAFARYWLEQRQTFRPRGARLLRAELRQHGVSADLATAAADELVDSAEDDAYRAAQKRARTLPSSPDDEQLFKSRLAQFLARRGFNWDTISPVVDRLWRAATDPA